MEMLFSRRRCQCLGMLLMLALCQTLACSLMAEIPTVRIPDHGSFWRPPFGFRPTSPHPAVVRVTVAEQQTTANGSGALVALHDRYGLVLTNWHVVRDVAGDISVLFPEGFQSAGTILAVDEEWDLAAILVWRPQVRPIPIADVAPRPGDPLSIAGYGQGTYRAASGRCTQYVAPGPSRPYEMVELSVDARQGDSGGPIFNERGELAGILFGSIDGTTSGSYCGRVRRFVDDVWPPRPQSHSASVASTTTLPSGQGTGTSNPKSPARTRDGGESGYLDVLASASGRTTPRFDGDQSPREKAARWRDWVGITPFEQSKTFLAGIGLLTVLVQFSKFFFSDKETKKK